MPSWPSIPPPSIRLAPLIAGRKARGLLYGYALLLKDNIETDGPLPTTAGSMALLDNVPHRDAPLVARLRANRRRDPGQDQSLKSANASLPTPPSPAGARWVARPAILTHSIAIPAAPPPAAPPLSLRAKSTLPSAPRPTGPSPAPLR